MKKSITITFLLLLLFGYGQENLYRIYFYDGKIIDVINLKKSANGITCESIDGLNSMAYLDKDYNSYKNLVNGIPLAEFQFTRDGLTDYVVETIPDKSAAELYRKTLDWVNVTFNTPKEVIKGQIENDYIRIEGIKTAMVCFKSLGFDLFSDGRYQIEISLKDGKYKFDVLSLELYLKPSQYNAGGWSAFNLNEVKPLYKENGEIRNVFKLYPINISMTFNQLNDDLKSFLLGNTITTKKDW